LLHFFKKKQKKRGESGLFSKIRGKKRESLPVLFMGLGVEREKKQGEGQGVVSS